MKKVEKYYFRYFNIWNFVRLLFKLFIDFFLTLYVLFFFSFLTRESQISLQAITYTLCLKVILIQLLYKL